jgi:aspartyl-tRNA(Asn)/glutamyl-tRNA(Gln) amidotransferase subunit A
VSDALSWLSIRELSVLLRRGAISPVELTQHCLARLEGVGRGLNAVVTITADTALREARLAEGEIAAGLDRGPLHGIPYGLKDVVAATGAPTTWGAAPFREQHFEREATIVGRLRGAGAILCAKLATIEIAGGMGYDHPAACLTGATLNPWDMTRWASGSSSGPGAAVAAGALPFAIGSDTSGSILFPAAFTGVAGLRATYGRVSRAGVMALAWTLDRLGPMCRTADDCGLVLEAIAGHDRADPSTLRRSYAYSGRTPRRRGFRFGVIGGADEGIEPEIAANFRASLDILARIGTIETVQLPEFPYGEMVRTIVAAEAYSAFEDFIAAGRTAELTAEKARLFRLASALVPAHDYIRAQRIRRIAAHAFEELAGHYDGLVAPSLGVVAIPADEAFEPNLPAASPRPLNHAGVLAGSPTISVMNGLGAGGLPSGLQFAGASLAENAIIDAAAAFEAEAGLASLRPTFKNAPPGWRETASATEGARA